MWYFSIPTIGCKCNNSAVPDCFCPLELFTCECQRYANGRANHTKLCQRYANAKKTVSTNLSYTTLTP